MPPLPPAFITNVMDAILLPEVMEVVKDLNWCTGSTEADQIFAVERATGYRISPETMEQFIPQVLQLYWTFPKPIENFRLPKLMTYLEMKLLRTIIAQTKDGKVTLAMANTYNCHIINYLLLQNEIFSEDELSLASQYKDWRLPKIKLKPHPAIQVSATIIARVYASNTCHSLASLARFVAQSCKPKLPRTPHQFDGTSTADRFNIEQMLDQVMLGLVEAATVARSAILAKHEISEEDLADVFGVRDGGPGLVLT
ncbi:hypothetical protein MMC25_005217 [Agyrium rufum]|nr:hypothetical protein [Agyrium rufum]